MVQGTGQFSYAVSRSCGAANTHLSTILKNVLDLFCQRV